MFISVLQKVCKMSGWKPGDPQYNDMETLFNTIWEKLNKTANDDGDEEISEEEWVRTQKIACFCPKTRTRKFRLRLSIIYLMLKRNVT